MKREHYAALLEIREAGDWRLRLLGECGYLAVRIHQPALAETIFEGLCVLVPDCPIGPLGLAEIRLAAGDCAGCRIAATQALQTRHVDSATMALAYVLRARALQGMARHETARRDLATAARLEAGFKAPLDEVMS